MVSNRTLILLFILLMVFYSLITAQGDSTDPSNSNAYSPGGEYSILNHQGKGSVNLLNGQATYSVDLASISCKSGFNITANLFYSGLHVLENRMKNNDSVKVGWVGMNWNLGFSYIKVLHNNTTTMADDKWYFHSSNGSETEIVKSNGVFILKTDPFWHIVPHYNQPTPQDTPIISEWIVTKSDGSKLKFGDSSGSTFSSSWVHCDNRTVGTNLTGPTRFYYYKWDLSLATDVNGDSITFLYLQILRVANSQSYIGESYPWIIQTNTGDKIWFDCAQKDTDEGPHTPPPSNLYNIYEYDYLSRMRLQDFNGRAIDTLNFAYIFDVFHDKKRFLSSITSARGTGALNLTFGYNPASGDQHQFLTSITNSKIGKTITYQYAPNINYWTVSKVTASGSGSSGAPDITTNFSYDRWPHIDNINTLIREKNICKLIIFRVN